MINKDKRNNTLPHSSAFHLILMLTATVLLTAGCSTAENETATGSTDCNRITSRQIESKADAETDATYVQHTMCHPQRTVATTAVKLIQPGKIQRK